MTNEAGGINVLTAIENKACGRQIQSMLRARGIRDIVDVCNLSDAILQLSHGGKPFGLIICDFLGAEGHLKLLRFIRNEQTLFPVDTPVICIGALWTTQSIATVRAEGVSAILKLPVTDKDLGKAISGVLRHVVVAPADFHGPDPALPHREQTVGSSGKKAIPKSGSTGLEVIDDEHRLVFSHLSALSAAIRNWQGDGTIENILSVFKKFIVMHFSHEENLMNSFPYSFRDGHKKSHNEFLEKVQADSASAKGDAGKYAKLISLLYEWFVDHISGFDQQLVAELRRHVFEDAKTDHLAAQTATVVQTAYTLAMKIPVLSLRLDMDWSNTNPRSINEKIGDIFERMTNLMVLAESRVQAYGCHEHQLALLHEIHKAVVANAEVMVVSAAKQLIHYGQAIVSGAHGLPLGIGTAMSFQMNSVIEMVSVVGGVDAISEFSRAFVVRAKELVECIYDMENQSKIALADHASFESGTN